MIEGQLMPAGVIDSALLDGFLHVNREDFMDDTIDQKKRAYSDKCVMCEGGRILLSPIAAGLLLQHADLQPGHKTLIIGGGYGYECNILAMMGVNVFALQSSCDKIKKMILKSNFTIVDAEGSIAEGCKKFAPYQSIIVLGSLPAIPEKLLAQLDEHGALLTSLQDKKSPQEKNQLGNLVRIEKNGKINYFGQVAGLPIMAEFANHQHQASGNMMDRMAS